MSINVYDHEAALAQLAAMQQRADESLSRNKASYATFVANTSRIQKEMTQLSARRNSLERTFEIRRALRIYDLPDAEFWVSYLNIH